MPPLVRGSAQPIWMRYASAIAMQRLIATQNATGVANHNEANLGTLINGNIGSMDVEVNAGNIVTNATGIGTWNSVNLGTVRTEGAGSHNAKVSVGNVILNTSGVGTEAAVNVGSLTGD